MEGIIEGVQYLYANYSAALGASGVVVGFLLGVAMIIPGEQPDKFLRKMLGFIEKYSKK